MKVRSQLKRGQGDKAAGEAEEYSKTVLSRLYTYCSMAANSWSSSDSETDEFVTHAPVLNPYQFEPTKDSSSSDSNDISETGTGTSSSDTEHELNVNRRGNVDWCQCRKCDHTLLQGDREHLCCQENPKLQAKAEKYPGKQQYYTFYHL